MAGNRGHGLRPGGPPTLGLGVFLVVAWLVLGVLGPALAPHSPIEQIDPPSGRYLPPLSERSVLELRDGRVLLAESVVPTADGLRFERLGVEEELTSDEFVRPEDAARPPSRIYLLGSDELGRDLWSRLLAAAQRSLLIGLVAVILAATIGVGVGSLSALAGGVVDGLIMRVVDALLAFPRLFLVIALAAVFSSGEWVLIAVLGGTGWMGISRQVRAQLLSLREREFVLAAEGIGQSPAAIVRRHLLPNALTPVIVETALSIGDVLLVEAALSFVGLGIQPPDPSWGNLIAEGRPVLLSAWWISLFPGLAIVLTVLSFHLLGDGLRDRLNPRSML